MGTTPRHLVFPTGGPSGEALEAFGGVRYTTAGKLAKENVLLDSPGIRMLGRHHKGGKTRFRQGQPDNLFLWLRHAPESCWAMTPRERLRTVPRLSGTVGASFRN